MDCLDLAVQYTRLRLQTGDAESAIVTDLIELGIMTRGVETILRLAKSSNSASGLRIPSPKDNTPLEEELPKALDQLIGCLGVRENISSATFARMLSRGDPQGCVQLIATKLGLPVRISLSYISEDSKAGVTQSFRTTALVRTGSSGRGSEGIVAQVEVPRDLPMYGTQPFQEYTVHVRISRNCLEHPLTFVAIIAHELSHILLASLWHPKRESEWHTDLVPIVLGFREIVRGGRKRVSTIESDGTETTLTTTYGYLTDALFESACEYVTNFVKGLKSKKKHLTSLLASIRPKTKAAKDGFALFQIYLQYLDKHPPKRMHPNESQKLVQYHALGYTDRLEATIREANATVEEAGALIQSLTHYTDDTVKNIEKYLKRLAIVTQELGLLKQRIDAHIMVLKVHIPLLFRIRTWISGEA